MRGHVRGLLWGIDSKLSVSCLPVAPFWFEQRLLVLWGVKPCHHGSVARTLLLLAAAAATATSARVDRTWDQQLLRTIAG